MTKSTKSTKATKAAKAAVSVKPDIAAINFDISKVCHIVAKVDASADKHESARAAMFAEIHALGVGGELPSTINEQLSLAIVESWQGKVFAQWYAAKPADRKEKTREGKGSPLPGGGHERVTYDRITWGNRVGSKLAKIKRDYAAYVAMVEAQATMAASIAAGKPVDDETRAAATGARRVATPAESTLNELAKQRNKIVRLIDKARDEKHVKDREHLAAFGDARAVIKALDQAASIIKKSK